MAFKQNTQRKILRDPETKERLPCVMCGTVFPLPEAAHIIDQREWIEKKGEEELVNGIPFCPNCHKVFDDVLRPYLYRALAAFGCSDLPLCWRKSNKVSDVTDKRLPIEEND
ncbi:MAG: hypothetical protein HC904_17430 [Blastochloris sp.]|nr:hypothetical protein [Blastochloris sp.]